MQYIDYHVLERARKSVTNKANKAILTSINHR